MLGETEISRSKQRHKMFVILESAFNQNGLCVTMRAGQFGITGTELSPNNQLFLLELLSFQSGWNICSHIVNYLQFIAHRFSYCYSPEKATYKKLNAF